MNHIMSKLARSVCWRAQSTCGIHRWFCLSTPRFSARPVMRARRSKQGGLPFDAYVMLVIPVAAIGLGTWQVKRRQWKLNLLDELEQKSLTPAIPFPEDLSELDNLEYRCLHVSGEFDHSREIIISPRSRVMENEAGGGLISAGGGSNIGCQVITPFKLADRDITILINRGWVPRHRQHTHKRAEGQVTGQVNLSAVVRKTEKRAQFAMNNDPEKGQFHRRDIEELAKILCTAEIFLDADKNSTVPGGPIGGQTRVTLRNEHVSYIITWYSLALITSYMWYARYLKRLVI